MSWLRRLIRVVFRRRDDEHVDAELQQHIEFETEELVRHGVPRDDARRRALVAFGGVDRVRADARETRRIGWLDQLYFDTRHVLRSLRRRPGLPLVVVLTLAVGVGANAPLYGLVSTLMFRPPSGVHAPNRLVAVNAARNYIKFLDIHEQATTLAVAAYHDADLNLGAGAEAVELRAECVTAGYFPVLGARPLIGRTFGSDAHAEQRDPAVVISHGLWQRQFGGSRHAIGQAVSINDRRHTVVGVMPSGFSGVTPNSVDAWILLTVSPDTCSRTGRSMLGSSRSSYLDTVGRLADGVTLEQAAAEIGSLATPDEVFEREAQPPGTRQPELRPLQAARTASVAKDAGLAVWLFAGSVVVLLIACANVAGLLSIRAIDRRRETTVRLQLGASRARILRHFAIEQLVIAAGCAAGAIAVMQALNRVLSAFFPYVVVSDVIGANVFWLTCGLAAGASGVSAVVPAVQTSRARSMTFAESSGFSTREQSFFRSSLLAVQVALAFALVVGGGLFTRSVLNTRQNLGYNPDGLYVVAADLQRAGVRSPADVSATFAAMKAAIQEQPDVQAVGVSSGSFLNVGGPTLVRPVMSPSDTSIAVVPVSPDYFAAIGVRLIQGRLFTPADGRSAKRVAVVDESVARELWPGANPIGKCDTGAAFPISTTCREIVGVIEGRRLLVGSSRAAHALFTPLAQADDEHGVPRILLIRVKDASQDAHQMIASAARRAVPGLPYLSVRSFDDLADIQTRSWRLGRAMFGMFSVIGVFLCALGLYSLLALAARQRTTEIGVRMALGAAPADIARLVLRHAVNIIGVGWVLGIAAAFLAGRSLQTLLFQIQSTDALTFAAASAVVLFASGAGCVLPAVKAAMVSPVEVLRHE